MKVHINKIEEFEIGDKAANGDIVSQVRYKMVYFDPEGVNDIMNQRDLDRCGGMDVDRKQNEFTYTLKRNDNAIMGQEFNAHDYHAWLAEFPYRAEFEVTIKRVSTND